MAVFTALFILACALYRVGVSVRERAVDVDGVLAVIVTALVGWLLLRMWHGRGGV
jgi:hypothetical protein